MRRCISVLACAIAIMFVTAPSALADEGGIRYAHNNVVEAANSDSANPVVRTGMALAYDAQGDPVTDTNIAYAHSFSCTGCRTVAVAVQVVIVDGFPSNFQPGNAAVAVNDSCHSCQTFAYAHQYVIQLTHRVDYQGGDVQEQLGRISWQISRVAHSSEDFATMSSQLDQLSLQFYNTVNQALQNQDHSAEAGAQKSERRQQEQKD